VTAMTSLKPETQQPPTPAEIRTALRSAEPGRPVWFPLPAAGLQRKSDLYKVNAIASTVWGTGKYRIEMEKRRVSVVGIAS